MSLVPSVTELLFALGLGEHVVARTTFCVHPRHAVAALPRVGGTKQVRIERLRAVSPTHVIVNVDENRREDAERIARLGVRVVVTHPLSPDDNPGLFRLLGAVFGARAAAERLCRDYERARAGLAAAARALPARRVLYLIWRDPWMTVSRDTYVSRFLALANWHTHDGGGGARYPEIALAPALLDAVDMVLFSSEPYPFKAAHHDEVRAHCGGNVPEMVDIDGEMTSWYGSRAVAGLDYLRRLAGGLA